MKVLIVGGGVAGISLFQHLLAEQQDVFLLDRGTNVSSSVAAGMINPLVFRRMTKSWRVDEFLPYLKTFYREMERNTDSTCFHPIPIRRLFSSKQELDFWTKKELNPEFSRYLHPLTAADLSYNLAPNDYGSGRVAESFWVNTKVFIPSALKWIEDMNRLIQEQMNYANLNPESSKYNGIKYDKIIFCEGAHNRENPWFNDLPIHATKGETLTITSDFLPEDESLNRKCFVLPIKPKTFRVGATYTWHTYDASNTQAGLNELKEKLAYTTRQPYMIEQQEAGIRPTTPDRRPIIGQHPEHAALYIFNGLGTKGYMLAPLLAKEFVNHLIHGDALSPEVDIRRFIAV